jgi:hypothetical protein
MSFIEWVLFQDKRTNLIVHENLLVDFIGIDSEYLLLKGISSSIIEWTWSFPKSYWSILLASTPNVIYWREVLSR